MFIAKDQFRKRIILGTQIKANPQYASRRDLQCPICRKQVMYNPSAQHPFDYFSHVDGTPDCTGTDSANDGHRLPVENSIKMIHNRLREVTGEWIDIDVERRIGDKRNFRITDIRVEYPVQIAAEIYYRSADLELSRRLRTMFSNGYRAYVVFNLDGRYDVAEVERDIQQIAPLKLGRFDPETMELSLGDLFDRNQISFDKPTRESMPNYLL